MTDIADILIIGGGSAGCVLAARLSEDAHRRVVLVEAGRDLRVSDVPSDISNGYPGRAFLNQGYLWKGLNALMGASKSNAPGARVPRRYEQPKILGGGSVINAMVTNRGAPSDYDEWGDLGASGWNWDCVLPYFRKLETDCDFDDEFHGQDGPITVRRREIEKATPFVHAVREVLAKRGLEAKADQNGVWEDGFYPVAVGCKPNGERLPVSLAYLTEEVRRRPNLQILTDTLVTRLIFEGKQVIGAETQDGRKLLARETIVSFGGIHSPAFLMRNGIGPAAQLRDKGIEVVADRRGIGRNLREHPSLAVSAFIPRGLRLHEDGVHQSQTCIKMSSGLPGTGVGDLFFQTLAKSAWHAMGRRLGTMFFWINKSYSTGSLWLNSPDFRDEPGVDFNFLSDDRDRQRIMQCVRFAGGILKELHSRGTIGAPFPTVFSDRVKKVSAVTRSNALQLSAFGTLLDMVGEAPREALLRMFVTEGPKLDDLLNDEAALEAFVLKSVGGTWHPSGTCRMGSIDDPDAVTDNSGRVIGVSGLRVCDASIMPTIPRANTNVPVIMIAERIADLIKQEERAIAA